ncbi:MAG: 3-oxo-tetronate kinase [Ideonella sp.]
MIFGGLADDLTGGLELAAMLVAEGVPSLLVTSARAVPSVIDAHVVVVAQKTRIAPAAEARERFDAAAQVLLAGGARQLFFKYCATFDSTDQGNIGPCIEVLMQRTGSRFTACCPTFPEYQRAVFQGHLFVADRLVSESPKRDDPVTPMRDPDLVRVLQRQTSQRVGLIAHADIRAGAAAIQRRAAQLQAEGIGCAIADAAVHEDLQHLAAATVDWPLMTGGSSIAAHYPPLWRARGWLGAGGLPVTLPNVTGPGVVLAGSCAEQTRRQLEHFSMTHPTLTLDLEACSRGADVLADALAWATARLAQQPVAISTSAAPDAVARLQSRLGVAAAAALAEQLLGRIAAGLRDAGVRRFVVAGGETSGAVLEHLGVERLRVGPFAGPSLPLALDDGRAAADPLILCLKSGKLGPLDAFGVALDAMAAGSDQHDRISERSQ